MLHKKQIKGPYSSVLPKFEFPALTDDLITQHGQKDVAIYPTMEGEPIVIAVKPDRLHIYVEFEGKMQELKYNAFNEDKYSQFIGSREEKLRGLIPGWTLFGYFSDRISVFHVWDNSTKKWLDTRQTEIPHIGRIHMPRQLTAGKLEQLSGKFQCLMTTDEDKNIQIFVRSINDPGLFWVVK